MGRENDPFIVRDGHYLSMRMRQDGHWMNKGNSRSRTIANLGLELLVCSFHYIQLCSPTRFSRSILCASDASVLGVTRRRERGVGCNLAPCAAFDRV